jgi:hypothetical protein
MQPRGRYATVTRVSDVAALVVPAASGLAGAALGAVAAFKIAKQQILAVEDAASAQAQREAVLWRRELYASFIAAASSVESSWLGVVGRYLSPEALHDEDQDRARAYEQLHRYSAMIRIAATGEVEQAAEDVLDHIRATKTQVAEAFRVGYARIEQTEPWESLEASFASGRNAFVAAVRRAPESSLEPVGKRV